MNQETGLEGSIAQSPYAGRSAQMFPRLTPLQIARLSTHSRKLTIQKGQILAEPGDHPPITWCCRAVSKFFSRPCPAKP